MSTAYKTTILIVIMMIVSILYIKNRREKVAQHSRITVAQHIKWEADVSGSTSTFGVLFNDKVISVNTAGNSDLNEGAYYYVKILTESRIEILKILGPVPSCLDFKNIPKKGWDSIPSCQ